MILMEVLSDKEKEILIYSTDCEKFMKEVLRLDVKWFHREWLKLFETHTHISLLAPRGHGKSILVGAYILWRILRNSLLRVGIITINQDKANEMMGFVQNHLMTNVKVKEGNRERLQAFEGVVIAKRNRGLNSAFTVRKISHGVGVERVFQTHSPLVGDIQVKRRGAVRRAKLYYLRELSGRAARIKEKL